MQHDHWMMKCLQSARVAGRLGNYPLASAIVIGERLVSLCSSDLVNSIDPTAHPEIQAIREAAAHVGSRYLLDAVLYSTLEPCPMCVSAAIWAKCDAIVFGARQLDAVNWAASNPDETLTWRQIVIPAEDIAAKGTPKIQIVPGVMRDECLELFALGRVHTMRLNGSDAECEGLN